MINGKNLAGLYDYRNNNQKQPECRGEENVGEAATPKQNARGETNELV